MSKFEEVEAENLRRRQRAVEGKYNCIPFPFPRFRKLFAGIEQSKYYIITANQKVGKSKLADFIFIYEPLFQMMQHPELKVKVLYFSLEMSEYEKYNEFLCHLMARLDNKHFDSRDMKSTAGPRDPVITELIHSDRYKPYIEAYEKMVETIDDIKNPTGIFMRCRDYALEHGHINYIPGKVKDPITGKWEDGMVKSTAKPYIQDDEDEYRIIIIDNATNLTREKDLTEKADIIEKMSKYGIDLRKDYNYIFVLIQHQAQAQEGVENIKLGRMRPTVDGLGDNKRTSRDISCIFGLYNPAKFLKDTEKEIYEGYNIRRLGKHCRFLEIIDDRDSSAGGSQCPLFFDGAISRFKELPPASDKAELERFYKWAEQLDTLEQREDLALTNP